MQFGPQNPPPKIPTEEDALNFIVRALRETKGNLGNYGYEVYMPHVFDLYLKDACGFRDLHDNRRAYQQIAPAFYAAVWELCRRGVLRPGVMSFGGQETGQIDGYSIRPLAQNGSRRRANSIVFPSSQGGSQNCSMALLPASAQASKSGPKRQFAAIARMPISRAVLCAERRQSPSC